MQMDLFNGDDGEGGNVVPIQLHTATRQRYLNYALSVITGRALPDVRDGLKPVQRRILYCAYKDLKLRHNVRYLKSARLVGDTMGRYHPHGDQSIYDATVRMAQSFSLRYPLVDGQGNFGSIDGDPPAAMRYTEVRLQSLAEELLSELGRGTVDYRPTYDGQLQEPMVLPVQFPNLLCNGATGIAVGMATNIPPHNLAEVIDGLVALIDDPTADLPAIMQHIKAPDFPTGGEILNTYEELQAIYETGQGPVRMRGTHKVEVINRKRHVILTSVPYGQNKSTLIEKIAHHIETRKVPQIVDIRDESTDDVRIVMELKRGASPEVAMAYLYKNTPLQQNFNVNLTCLIPGEDSDVCSPARLGLVAMLRHFLDFRLEIVTRRLENRLAELRKQIHRLEGFELVFDILDEIIALIRSSDGKADAARKMVAQFDLDEEQADSILELKLYRLAKLEILQIQQELAEKRAERDEVERLLSDVGARWKVVRTELLHIRDAYCDARRTTLVGPQVEKDFDPEAYIVKEKTWVMVSRLGRVKRQKGFSEVAAIRVPDGDETGWVLRTDTRHTMTFYTQFGRAYVLRVDDIVSTTGYGDPVQASFNFADGERIVGVTCADGRLTPPIDLEWLDGLPDEDPKPPYAISVSKSGKITRFPIAGHADVSTRNGRKYMSLAKGDEVVGVLPYAHDQNVALASRDGRVIMFEANDVPVKENAVRGVNAIKLDKNDTVLGFALARKKRDGLRCYTNRGRELIVRETSYAVVKRGGKGKIVIRVGSLAKCDWPVQVLKPGQAEEEAPEELDGETSELELNDE